MTTPSLPASGHGEVAGLVEELHKPQAGEIWQHHSGRHYRVLFIANDVPDPKPGYQPTVVYEGVDNGKRWSGPLSDWHRRMTLTPSPVEARADGVREALERALIPAGRYETADPVSKARSNFAVEILAALESTPTQPVQEGQEGKAEPVARRWRSRIKGGAWDAWEQGRYGGEAPPFMEIEERPVPALASQPDPAAEIARLTKERDRFKAERDDLADVMEREDKLLDLAKDGHANVTIALNHKTLLDRAERAESETTTLKAAVMWALGEGDSDFGDNIPPRAQRYWWRTELRLRAALANTADRGQEEKGNG